MFRGLRRPLRLLALFLLLAGLVLLGRPTLAAKPTPLSAADWPLYGGDLAGTRSNPSGPSASQLLTLHQAWRYDFASGDVTGTPVEAGGRVFAASDAGLAVALDSATGAPLWRRQLGGPVNSSAAVDGNHVFFSVATVGAPSVVALDARTGRVLWKTVLTSQPESDLYASPVVFGGSIVIGTSALFAETRDSKPAVRGTVEKLDEGTGAVIWRDYTVPAGLTGAGVWSTAAIDPLAGRAYEGTGNA